MSHKNPLRKDKTCLNCNHVVDLRFCPNCGQENTDTRKTFHHLFIHFFEDLTHYENAFWKTIKNLLLKPAALTKEYLSGKRLSYLAPVRLYIFISFVTFFVFAFFPDEDSSEVFNEKTDKITTDTISKQEIKIDQLTQQGMFSKTEADSLKKLIEESKKDPSKDNFINFGYNSIEKMDSIRKVNPDEINDFEYWITKKMIPLNQKYTNEEFGKKFLESIEKNFPKTLFIFMPLFAFVLWVFHDKKRFYYFDHGIFTLHYFSFLLLISLLSFLLNKILYLFGNSNAINGIEIVINTIGYIWMFYYFFPAHHRFYGETRLKSFFKSSIIFIINWILFSILIILFVLYTLINIL